MKTVKLVAKRLRITRNKKVMRRIAQQGHFKSKESGNVRRNKRRQVLDSGPVFTKLTHSGTIKAGKKQKYDKS